MDSFTLSRNWFNFSFENPEKINKKDIFTHIIKRNVDYSKGGFYLIINELDKKCYIGKSINYMSRLKQHLYHSNKSTNIDIALNLFPDKFEFYLLAKYLDLNINHFNRKLELIIEHRFITTALIHNYTLYNRSYYGHL